MERFKEISHRHNGSECTAMSADDALTNTRRRLGDSQICCEAALPVLIGELPMAPSVVLEPVHSLSSLNWREQEVEWPALLAANPSFTLRTSLED